MTLPQATQRNGKHSRIFSGLKTKTIYKIRIMSGKGITYYYNSNVIWRTLSRLVDEIIPSDRVASWVIRWYDLINSTRYSTPDQVTTIIMCLHRLISYSLILSMWALS